jgi:hypothetical protein
MTQRWRRNGAISPHARTSCSIRPIKPLAGPSARGWWRVPTSRSCRRDAYGPGMRWEPTHVNPMLALRTAVCNDQWSEAWSVLEQQRQCQQKEAQASTAGSSSPQGTGSFHLAAAASPSSTNSSPGSCRASTQNPSSLCSRCHLAGFLASFCPPHLEMYSCLPSKADCKKMTGTPLSSCS